MQRFDCAFSRMRCITNERHNADPVNKCTAQIPWRARLNAFFLHEQKIGAIFSHVGMLGYDPRPQQNEFLWCDQNLVICKHSGIHQI